MGEHLILYRFRLHHNNKTESTVNTQPLSFSTRPSTVNSQQSTVNNSPGVQPELILFLSATIVDRPTANRISRFVSRRTLAKQSIAVIADLFVRAIAHPLHPRHSPVSSHKPHASRQYSPDFLRRIAALPAPLGGVAIYQNHPHFAVSRGNSKAI